MHHIELIEPRRMMANTGLDETFGVGGALVLPEGYRLRNTLGAGNSIYVDLYHKTDNTRWIYKFDPHGRPETPFGDNGRVQLFFDKPATDRSKLALDAYYGDLYVATTSLYQGDRDVHIQRFRSKTGKRDKAFNTKTVILPGGDSATGEIGHLEPVVRRELLILSTIKSTTSSSNGNSTGTQSVRLTRLLSDGRADASFSGDGTTTVSIGNFANTDGGLGVYIDQPKAVRVGGLTDTSYEVVTTRHTAYYRLSSIPSVTDDPTIISGTDLQSAELVTVNTDGSVSTASSEYRSLPLVRTQIDPAKKLAFSNPKLWVPLAVQKADDDSLVAIGGRYRGRGQVSNPIRIVVSPQSREIVYYGVADLDASVIASESANGTYGFGNAYLRAGDGVRKLNAQWLYDKRFGVRSRISVEPTLNFAGLDSEMALLAVSDDGRMLYRFDGTV